MSHQVGFGTVMLVTDWGDRGHAGGRILSLGDSSKLKIFTSVPGIVSTAGEASQGYTHLFGGTNGYSACTECVGCPHADFSDTDGNSNQPRTPIRQGA